MKTGSVLLYIASDHIELSSAMLQISKRFLFVGNASSHEFLLLRRKISQTKRRNLQRRNRPVRARRNSICLVDSSCCSWILCCFYDSCFVIPICHSYPTFHSLLHYNDREYLPHYSISIPHLLIILSNISFPSIAHAFDQI